MRPDRPRDLVSGPESGPEPPFPIRLSGPVIKGFGRGSKELGIPTANIPTDGLADYPDLPSGVYYGFVGLKREMSHKSVRSYPAVLSIGYNPFYKNTVRSVEIHILEDFQSDFYGANLNLIVLGYIRPEYDYVSLESLVDDIRTDCEVARKSLDRAAYQSFEKDEELLNFSWTTKVDVNAVEMKVLGKI